MFDYPNLPFSLEDWKQVTEVAAEITKQTDRLDILVNNAARGIMTYQLSPQNCDVRTPVVKGGPRLRLQ